MTAKRQSSHQRYVRLVIYSLLLGLLALLIVKQRATLGTALSQATEANKAWLSLGVAAMALSLPATALVYISLSSKHLQFGRTVVVQTAGFCVNKLLPSGSGAAGMSFLYLRANKIPAALAGSIVALNNLLGLVGHFTLLWVLVALEPSILGKLTFSKFSVGPIVLLVGAGFGLAFVALGVLFRARLRQGSRTFVLQIKPLLRNRPALLKALGFSMIITLCYTMALYASTEAVGASISLSAAIIALSSSVLATSAIPSPGGIGAAELGAYGGLVAVGVNSEAALAAALLYRVCSFWLPLAFGSVAFAVVAKRGYLRVAK